MKNIWPRQPWWKKVVPHRSNPTEQAVRTGLAAAGSAVGMTVASAAVSSLRRRHHGGTEEASE